LGGAVIARAALGHRQRASVRHDVSFRRLVGGVVRCWFSGRLGDAGRPVAVVTQGGAKLGGAHAAAEQAVGGVEDVFGGEANLRGVALDRLEGIALGIWVAALVLQRAQDLRQLGEAEGMFDGHRWRPLIGATGCGAFYAPEPRRPVVVGANCVALISQEVRRAHEGVSGLIHQL
jgi:hypothetical protein